MSVTKLQVSRLIITSIFPRSNLRKFSEMQLRKAVWLHSLASTVNYHCQVGKGVMYSMNDCFKSTLDVNAHLTARKENNTKKRLSKLAIQRLAKQQNILPTVMDRHSLLRAGKGEPTRF